MIKLKKITAMPKLPLSPYAQWEWNNTSEPEEKSRYIFNHSRVWLLSVDETPVMILGVWKLSLVGSGNRLWAIALQPLKDYGLRVVRFLRRAIRMLKKFCGALSSVTVGNFKQNEKFARLVGFNCIGFTRDPAGRQFHYFEAR